MIDLSGFIFPYAEAFKDRAPKTLLNIVTYSNGNNNLLGGFIILIAAIALGYYIYRRNNGRM